ncbi:MAG: 5-oxoprolinase subunit PxpB [Verrucomicrobia bacterium]|nr:5-oxoprolinase subunit PxpB [Verrucomicrobiota bacterium]
MTISPLGDSALLVDFGDESSSAPELLDRALSVAAQLRRAKLRGVAEVTSAYQSVTVFLHLSDIDALPDIASHFERQIGQIVAPGQRVKTKGRLIEVPVCYGPEFALDEQRVTSATGLPFNSVVELHAAGEFIVACIGFMPGFPYLAGLPEALHLPRLPAPRARVPAGSVAVANGQAGIYPFESPGGWNIIGRTHLRLFDPGKTPPALLAPGDKVRFRKISREEFHHALASVEVR